MVVIGVLIGLIFIMLGLVVLTDRVDQYWRTRKTPPLPAKPDLAPPPFRTSPDQCVKCGNDDAPLSIDTGMCFWCFEEAIQ